MFIMGLTKIFTEIEEIGNSKNYNVICEFSNCWLYISFKSLSGVNGQLSDTDICPTQALVRNSLNKIPIMTRL